MNRNVVILNIQIECRLKWSQQKVSTFSFQNLSAASAFTDKDPLQEVSSLQEERVEERQKN